MYTRHFNEYEKYIDECADASNVDPQSIVDCVNDGRGIKVWELRRKWVCRLWRDTSSVLVINLTQFLSLQWRSRMRLFMTTTEVWSSCASNWIPFPRYVEFYGRFCNACSSSARSYQSSPRSPLDALPTIWALGLKCRSTLYDVTVVLCWYVLYKCNSWPLFCCLWSHKRRQGCMNDDLVRMRFLCCFSIEKNGFMIIHDLSRQKEK